MIHPESVTTWREAARDLGIDVTTPYEITDPASGRTIECIAYLRDFGSPGGMVIVPLLDPPSTHVFSVADGLSVYSSLVNEDAYSMYIRGHFIATLNDWAAPTIA